MILKVVVVIWMSLQKHNSCPHETIQKLDKYNIETSTTSLYRKTIITIKNQKEQA